MQRGDRGLGLVGAEPIAGERPLEQEHRFGDRRGVPPASILVGEGYEVTRFVGARPAASVVEQQQRHQTRGLGVVGDRGETSRQADGLGGEVDVAGVPLVEHEVQHVQHGAEVTGLVERHAGQGALGAADALGHRRLGDEVGLGDLAGREPAHGTKRQRHR